MRVSRNRRSTRLGSEVATSSMRASNIVIAMARPLIEPKQGYAAHQAKDRKEIEKDGCRATHFLCPSACLARTSSIADRLRRRDHDIGFANGAMWSTWSSRYPARIWFNQK